jgi:DNA-binding NarL/FixJ family response regulator
VLVPGPFTQKTSAGTVVPRHDPRHDADMDRPTVLIVDDHAGFRAHARALLTIADFEVVAEAADGRTALDQAGRFEPAIVLLDVQLPDIDGFGVARELVDGPSSPAVVLVSTRDAADYGRRLTDCGAVGFISKSRLSGDTLRAILRKSAKEGSR